MGVTTLPILDWLHHHFSHHIEHHLFPRMPGPGAPLVRTWLREKQGRRYVAPPHWQAVVQLYRTPRVYLDAKTLINPLTDETLRVSQITRRFGYDPLED